MGNTTTSILPPGWWWAEPGRLLVGRHPARALMAGLDPWGMLSKLGVSRVLSLVEASEDSGLPPSEPPEGFEHIRFPIPDFGVPTEDRLVEWVRATGRELSRSTSPLYIHCMGGCGRSGVMAAALLLVAGFCPAGELQERLDRRRKEAGLEPGCPETREQRDLVGRLGHLLGTTG